MKFAISRQRALSGNDIDVQIDAEGDETMIAVTCVLDGLEIGSDDLAETPVVSFHRSFCGVGDARPGQTHKLVVEVRGRDGNAIHGTRIWAD